MTAFTFFPHGVQFFLLALRLVLLFRQAVQLIKKEQIYNRNPPALKQQQTVTHSHLYGSSHQPKAAVQKQNAFSAQPAQDRQNSQ